MFECFKKKISVEKIKPWLDLAKHEIGVRELPGAENNPRILEYHRATSLKATFDSVPWCSAFVNWCFQASGTDKGTQSAAARSWLKWGEQVSLSKAEPGDVVIFSRGNSSWEGHVTFFIEYKEDRISCLGGNQNDSVSITQYTTKRLLGIRRLRAT